MSLYNQLLPGYPLGELTGGARGERWSVTLVESCVDQHSLRGNYAVENILSYCLVLILGIIVVLGSRPETI